MSKIMVRCYAELNDLLPLKWQFVPFEVELTGELSIIELANKIGIPINKVDLILLNNQPAKLSTILSENDRVAFYPVFESFDISLLKQFDKPLRESKFIADVHLGKLASFLRLFGFDTLYKNNWIKEELISKSIYEKRTLLTKSSSLVSVESITRLYKIKNIDSRLQLIEVLDRFDLYNCSAPFSRCIRCNSILTQVEKETIINRIPPRVKEWCNEYLCCRFCDKIYWKGSHFEYMNAFVQDILRSK